MNTMTSRMWLALALTLVPRRGVHPVRPAEGLKNAAVYDLTEDRGGRYWIATGGGAYRFTPNPREFLKVSGRGGRLSDLRAAGECLGQSRFGDDHGH